MIDVQRWNPERAVADGGYGGWGLLDGWYADRLTQNFAGPLT